MLTKAAFIWLNDHKNSNMVKYYFYYYFMVIVIK